GADVPFRSPGSAEVGWTNRSRLTDYSTNAPDLKLAASTFSVHAADMAKRRKPIDGLIDAHVWMRRDTSGRGAVTRVIDDPRLRIFRASGEGQAIPARARKRTPEPGPESAGRQVALDA